MEHKSNLQRIRDSPALTHITFLTGPQTDHLLALMAAWDFLSLSRCLILPYILPARKKKNQEWTTAAGSAALLGGGGEEGKVAYFFLYHAVSYQQFCLRGSSLVAIAPTLIEIQETSQVSPNTVTNSC